MHLRNGWHPSNLPPGTVHSTAQDETFLTRLDMAHPTPPGLHTDTCIYACISYIFVRDELRLNVFHFIAAPSACVSASASSGWSPGSPL
ncbi:hypothetical protein DUNSADRAFT_4299 [Dunaliella salina]|uniref:Encoded protein n=1 Tax=Dunaliella salina TaxID=3046 RepID=A0ABQ7GSC5_DUNSA|nr:hypothetical protein DUNSADRAFT_4299 [Dunaliella salina]|eukprot:KAF5837497.1 hypothetical protein DUNSADRAFT_4299 [Dunaliella salina]